MALRLPSPFLAKMKSPLGKNYDNFMKSYELVPNAGIRVNTLKISREEFMKLSPLTLRPSPGAPPVTILRPGSVRDGILTIMRGYITSRSLARWLRSNCLA